jgi:transposase in mobilizable transposon, tnpA protein
MVYISGSLSGSFNDSKMSTSNIRIKKVCEWCGKEFLSQKCSTRFCCKRCAEHAYKERKRQERKSNTEAQVQKHLHEKAEAEISAREYLSISEAAKLLGVTRDGVYKLIYRGTLTAYKISSRFTVILRSDIDAMIRAKLYVRTPKSATTVSDENGEAITEFYTTKEIIEKFGVSNSWVFAQGKARNIPKVYHRGKTLWSKSHCDRVFSTKPETPKETDWISYSSVRTEYNLTHDQLHNYVKYHGLRHKKVGKYSYILKSEIDAILRPPTLK